MAVSVQMVGVDNSPWVQTVLLFLHDRGIPCELSALPSLETFRCNGNVIPVIQIYKGDKLIETIADSFSAMRHIDCKYPNGKAIPDNEDEALIQAKLEELFFEGAFQRFSPISEKWWKFPLYFARQPETVSSEMRALLGSAAKAFHLINFGFFLLIGALCNLWFGHPRINSRKQGEAQLDFWEQSLGKDPTSFLHGKAEPSRVDFALFGQLQMLFSGLSEPMVARIMGRPRMVAYIQHMNQHFKGFTFNLYSRRVDECMLHEHAPGVKHASLMQTLVTLTVLVFLVTLGLPLVAIFIFHSQWIRRSNKHASGRKLDPKCYWGRLLRVKAKEGQGSTPGSTKQSKADSFSGPYAIVARVCAASSVAMLLKELVELASDHPGALDYRSMLSAVVLAAVAAVASLRR
jgi:glutathione S-transferase